MKDILLEVRNLSASYRDTEAVRGVSLAVERGEIVGIVGESGSGKSTMLKSILGLLGRKARESGSVRYRGEELRDASPARLRQIRGKEIGMIFQHPQLAMDPLCPIHSLFYESIRVHRKVSRQEARRQGRELLEALDFPDPERILAAYPFELSGGECQRAAIAAALVNRPALLLADEPTSALDVTVQKQVIQTIRKTREQFGTAVLMVSHNMGVIGEIADRVGVMRTGELVEWGRTQDVFRSPQHPYTQALLRAVPRLEGLGPGQAGAMEEKEIRPEETEDV